MGTELSPQLERRLAAIARNRNCSLEELLTEFADQTEEHNFPGNAYRFFELSVALICVADLEGNFLYVNPTFSHVLGYDKDTLLSQPFMNFVHPEDIAKTQEAMQRLRGGLNVTQFENRYRCQDGSYRWLAWASTIATPSVYAIALDITEQKQTKQRLEVTLAQNQQMLEAIFDGYIEGDLDGNIREVNQNYCDMLGYTREELLQMTVFDLDAGMEFVEIDQNVNQIVDEDVAILIETQQRHKDGHLIDVEINTIKLPDEWLGTFIRDITERKKLENQLRRSEQLHRGIIDSQIDFVCRYTPDTRLTFVNEAYREFFGRPREELIGSSYLDMGQDTQSDEVLARIARVIENPTPEVRTFPAYDASGKQRWIQWIDFGITDKEGNVIEIQAVGRDITPLIETQKQLANREEMLSTIFHNIPVLLIQFTQGLKAEYVNKHWMDIVGWKAEEINTHPDILMALYPDQVHRQQALDMLSGNSGWHDFKTCAKDGTLYDISWANVHLSNGSILGIGQVITHRVELENQRIYAQQLELELEKERELREIKERFISLISHEFRMPLAVMTTSIDMIIKYFERLSIENIHDKLRTIQHQIQRMVDLMEDTLQFSKAQAGKTDFTFEPVNIRSLLQGTIETFNMTHNASHLIMLSCDEGVVHADPRLLDHVMSNLLSNALKYSPTNSTVTVTVSKHPECWEFKVQDEGIGIPETDLPLLFEPFHRAKNVRDFPGTGLGLSIVRDYIELHGGEIRVESSVGLGSTFIFTVPM